MEKKYQPFEKLDIWKEGMEVCYTVYDNLSKCHDFGSRNQMERSAVSIPSNIAEGYELNSDRGFIRHLRIAKVSAGELRTQLYLAIRLKYIPSEQGNNLVTRSKILSGMIQNFITARRKRVLTKIIKKTISIFILFDPLLP